MRQTVGFAAAVCLAVCIRSLYLLQTGDVAAHMAVLLFGGLTAIGVAYGLTALPAASRIPLVLITVPLAFAALTSNDPRFTGAAFGLAVVAAITMRLLSTHSRHFTDVIRSRSAVVGEQERAELARQEAMIAATTDFLTGLPNRRAFVAAIEAAMGGYRGSAFAVAVLDLNRFKAVNDTFGHASAICSRGSCTRLVAAVGDTGWSRVSAAMNSGSFFSMSAAPSRPKLCSRTSSQRWTGPVVLEGRQLADLGLLRGCACRRVAKANRRRGSWRMPISHFTKRKRPRRGSVANVRAPAWKRRAAAARGSSARSWHLACTSISTSSSSRSSISDWPRHGSRSAGAVDRPGARGRSAFRVRADRRTSQSDRCDQRPLDGRSPSSQARQWAENIKLSFNLSAIQLCTTRLGAARLESACKRRARRLPGCRSR